MPKRKRKDISPNKESNGLTNKSIDKHESSKDEQPWSKSKKKRMRKLLARQKRDSSIACNTNRTDNQDLSNGRSEPTNGQIGCSKIENDIPNFQSRSKRPISSLQQQFLSRLSGSRFRELNEELYTTTSASAFKRFQENPELFEQYHEGFRTQVKSWPVNPIDLVYKWIISYYHKNKNIIFCGENQQKLLRVADFGCGDAKLAEKLLTFKPNSGNRKKAVCPFKVHSFDLVANGNELITPCDMSNVPLKNSSVDIGVFVLALMGTNIADFIREAHRVLTPTGVLKIAEVRSRFESTAGDDDNLEEREKKSKMMKKSNLQNNNSKKVTDDTVLNEFLSVMEELGFRCVKKERQNKMFVQLEFEKTGAAPSKKASFTAKPCIYKRR